jgi:hypothetical protein
MTSASHSVPALAAIGVGIDTGRYGHHVTFLRPDLQPAAPPMAVSETAEGYQRLHRQLERLHAEHPQAQLLVRIDAGGCYAVNIEQFFRQLSLPIHLSIGQPLQNRRFREVHFPKRKADPVESLALARYALKEQPRHTPACPPHLRPLREIAARLQSQVRHTTRLVNQLHNLMARVFPELALLARDLSANWVLARLDHLDRLSGSGPQRRGPCPVHAPGSPRCRTFSVHLDRNVFRCFDARCGVQGNVLDLWAAVHGLPLLDAAHHLAAAFGLSTGTEKNPSSPCPLAESVGGPTTMT